MRKVLLMLLVIGIGLTFAAQYRPLSKAEAIKEKEFNIQVIQPKPVINKSTSSRSVIFSEDFADPTFPPTGWTEISTAPAESTWHRSTTIYHSEPASAAVWWSWQHQDEWLISPSITLTGAPNNAYYLKWWYYGYRGSTWGDHYYTKLITSSDTILLYDLSTQAGQWNYFDLPVEIDLSLYAGQTVKIAFHAFDGYPSNIGLWYAWGIDDVEVGYLDIQNDVGVIDIDYQWPIVSGTAEPITITVKNFGVQTQTSIPVYLYDGTTTLSETLICNLPSLAETIYTFTWEPEAPGDYDLYAWTDLPLDEDHSNDTAMISVSVYPPCPPAHIPPYSKDFNEPWGPWGDVPPYCGWVIEDYGTEDPPEWNYNDWFHGQLTNPPRSLAAVTYGLGINNPEISDDWLISPRFDCSLPGTYTLGYWHWYRGYTGSDPDTGYVLVSTDGGETWQIITQYNGGISATIDSGYKSHDISALVAGQNNVKIAFRYFAQDALWWLVDDFTLDFIPSNTTLTININPTGAGTVTKDPDLP
ncbi:MAG: choice-of-anchor J domain-containing protein, partial [candidate division WOR-3 bacterium]